MLLSSAHKLKSRLIILCESPQSHQTFFLKIWEVKGLLNKLAGRLQKGAGCLTLTPRYCLNLGKTAELRYSACKVKTPITSLLETQRQSLFISSNDRFDFILDTEVARESKKIQLHKQS